MADRPRLILASGSPRRQDLLRARGIEPEVRVPDVDESILPNETPTMLVTRLAVDKLRAVVGPGEIGLAADTVVVVDDDILGKPVDADEAATMLRRLSGRSHTVVGGLAARVGANEASASLSTAVTFRDLADDEIAAYVVSGEPMDKAGAYAIQGGGAAFVTEVAGDHDNVVGLSVGGALELLGVLGVRPPFAPGRP